MSRKTYQFAPDKPCSKCQKRKRLIMPNGQAVAYCEKCQKALRREYKKRETKRKLALIKTDNPPICCRCKTEPVYHTKRTVYDYCYHCYRKQQKELAFLRKKRAFAQKINGGQS